MNTSEPSTARDLQSNIKIETTTPIIKTMSSDSRKSSTPIDVETVDSRMSTENSFTMSESTFISTIAKVLKTETDMTQLSSQKSFPYLFYYMYYLLFALCLCSLS